MPNKPAKYTPPRDALAGADAPTEALARPQGLKNWSQDLVTILKREESNLFNGWDFRPSDLTKADFTRILRKISGCGSVVELRSAVSRETGEVSSPHVHAANFCGQHTICPFCAARVQDRRKARFREPIAAAVGMYKHAYIVTATIPPVPTWREDLTQLMDSWKAFRKMGQVRGRRGGRSAGEWGKVLAGVSKIEIKRGDGSGLPHCHVHALFFTDEMLDYRVWSPEEKARARNERESLRAGNASKISEEWTRATDGKATGLNVKKIKWRAPKRRARERDAEYRARSQDWSMADSVFEQAREVLKYATKFDSAPATAAEKLFAQDFIGIRAATYGRRLFQTYGAFRGVGGSDFTDGSCLLKEKPVIYESRWRENRYSPLRERNKPLFQNCDPGPTLSARLRTLNRVQGATRRLRRAIQESKRHYLATGELVPAMHARREFLPDGGFVDHPVALEVHAAVAADPSRMDAWEKWVDEATESGRSAYAAAREDLDAESHFRIVGTAEDREVQAAIERRAFRYDPTYDELVIRSFLEVLAASSPPP